MLQFRSIVVERRPLVVGVQQLMGLVEVEHAHRQRIGFGVLVSARCAGPEHAVTHEGFVEQCSQNIAGKVRIGTFERSEIAFGEKVEDEEVVTLADEFGGDAARLLGDKERTEVVLAAFLDPGNERAIVAAYPMPRGLIELPRPRRWWGWCVVRLR